MRPAMWRALLLVLPLSHGLTLAWQEWRFRHAQTLAVQAPPAVPAPAPGYVALNTQAVATVFGLAAQTGTLNSREPLTLRATVVAGGGDSRALLAGADGARFYRAGERLPGGSLLRRIEAAHVVLWRQGREELLSLHPTGARFLQAAGAQSPAPSNVHLRATVEQPRSE